MGFSQDFAAQRLGISLSSVQSYERGTRADKKEEDGTTKTIHIPLLTSWAMAAITADLSPWGKKLES